MLLLVQYVLKMRSLEEVHCLCRPWCLSAVRRKHCLQEQNDQVTFAKLDIVYRSNQDFVSDLRCPEHRTRTSPGRLIDLYPSQNTRLQGRLGSNKGLVPLNSQIVTACAVDQIR